MGLVVLVVLVGGLVSLVGLVGGWRFGLGMGIDRER